MTELMDDAGIPDTFVCDFASKQTGTNMDLMKFICRLHMFKISRHGWRTTYHTRKKIHNNRLNNIL